MALTYAPSVGGAQEHVRRVAEGLAGRGHEVTVLTTDARRAPGAAVPGRVGPRREVIGDVQVRRFPVSGAGQRVRFLARRAFYGVRARVAPVAATTAHDPLVWGPRSLRLHLAVRRATRTDDVVVGCSAPFLTLVAPSALRGRRGGAVVAMPLLHLGSAAVHGRTWRALRASDGVTASTLDEREVEVAAGVDAERIAVLPPGTDPTAYPERTARDARRELGLPDRPTVGYVGRLAARKGIDDLLAAAPALWARFDDLTVLVAGSPTGWAGLAPALERARATGGDRLVVREGFPDEERALLLSACDVIAFPSHEESFGMVTAEAWAARRPVVAADVPAVRTVVHHGVDGALVPVADPAALGEALADLLADPDRAAAWGRAGRDRVERELSWPVIVEGWDRLLASSVDHRRRTRADAVAGGRG